LKPVFLNLLGSVLGFLKFDVDDGSRNKKPTKRLIKILILHFGYTCKISLHSQICGTRLRKIIVID